MQQKQSLTIKGRAVTYVLIYKKVKNVNIRVKADGIVWVSAPQWVSPGQIKTILLQRADFILKALETYAALEQAAPKACQYQAGDTLWVLGKPLTLTVQQGRSQGLERTETGLLLTVRDPENETLRARTVEGFYKDLCLEITTRLIRQIQPVMEPLGVPLPEVKVRSMTSRWGSCKPAGKQVTFARQLMEAPLPCVEYVVCHELVHFIHPNHSPAFYAALAAFLPDWKARRELLNSYRYRQPL